MIEGCRLAPHTPGTCMLVLSHVSACYGPADGLSEGGGPRYPLFNVADTHQRSKNRGERGLSVKLLSFS